jgi:CrcB protein
LVRQRTPERLEPAFTGPVAQLQAGCEMLTYLWIAIGSALGGMARYACSRAVAVRYGETFPWGTLTVNVIGSVVIGFVAAVSAPEGRIIVSPTARNFLMVGLCGGFTTFSSFSLQTLELIRNRDFGEAFGNILLSVAACMAAVAIGYIGGLAVGGFRLGR